jgi:hypothetical protein
MDTILQFLTVNQKLFVALAALVAVLTAIIAVFRPFWRLVVKAMAAWRLARKDRTNQQRAETAAAVANLRSALGNVAKYFDRAYRIAKQLKDDLGSADIERFPLKRFEQLGDFPVREFLIARPEEEHVLGLTIKTRLDENRRAWRAWSTTLDEIAKRPNERIRASLLDSLIAYSEKNRKKAKQTATIFEFYVILSKNRSDL